MDWNVLETHLFPTTWPLKTFVVFLFVLEPTTLLEQGFCSMDIGHIDLDRNGFPDPDHIGKGDPDPNHMELATRFL